MQNYDVVVVGAGMNGLTVASAVAEKHFKVALIDKKPIALELKDKRDGRGISIARYSRKILESYGIWQYIAKDVGEIHKILIKDSDSYSSLKFDNELVDGLPLGFLIESDNILQGLYKKVISSKYITILDQRECKDIVFNNNRACTSLDDGTKLSSKAIIIADGKNSKIRSLLNMSFVEKDYHQAALVFNIKHSKKHHHYAYEHFFTNGPFALLPLQDQYQSSVVWTNDIKIAKLKLSKEELEQFLLEKCEDTHGKVEINSEISCFPLSLGYMRDYFQDRAVFIGDCLHFIHPLAGQGYNLSLRDIDALVKLIVEYRDLGLDIGSQTLFAEFVRQRKLDNFSMITITDRLNRFFSSDFGPLESIRKLGLEVVDNAPFLKKLFMEYAMGKKDDNNYF